MKFVFNVVVLVVLVIGLTPSPGKIASLSATTTAPATQACDFQSCYNGCVKKGYLGGTCGSITRTCVCYSYPPPPIQQP
jgi:hypothetical protein